MTIRTNWLAAVALACSLTSLAHAATATRTSAFDYDAATGMLSKEIIEPANSALCVVTTHGYDAYGHKTTATTRNCNGSAGGSPGNNTEAAAPAAGSLAVFTARTSAVSYTDPRFVANATNALNQSESSTVDPRTGAVTSTTGPNGLVTRWAYDSFGRKILEQQPDGNGTRWVAEYCAGVAGGTLACPTINGIASAYAMTAIPVKSVNAVAKTYGAQMGPTVRVYYDAKDRPIRMETQGSDAGAPAVPSRTVYQDTRYNALGQVVATSNLYFSGDAAIWKTHAYDALGRVAQTDTPDGGQTVHSYNGLTTSVTVKAVATATAHSPTTQTTSQTRDAEGQVIRVTDALGKTTTRAYDPFGNLLTTTDALGNVITTTYDTRGHKTTLKDPDMGSWSYDYNALGELVWQRNAKSQVTTMAYDVLGRQTRRTEPDLISNWYYDKYANNSACNKGIGKLCEATTSTGYTRRHVYDSLGRPSSAATALGATTYTASVTYNTDGRVDTQTYPSGLQVKNNYSSGFGFLKSVTNASTSAAYWQHTAADASGRITQEIYGNGLVGTNTFEPTTGRIKTQQVQPAAGILNLSYTYDYLGLLRTRSDGATSVAATYDYDALNRLKTETRSGGAVGAPQTITWSYDAIGNLTSRSDVGNYTYPASGSSSVRPHAVSSVTGTVSGTANPSYVYDANGNLTSGAGRTVGWMSYDMPDTVTKGTNALTWRYGPEHQRVQEVHKVSGSIRRTTVYLNPSAGEGLYYEEETGTAGTKKKHYITAGGKTVAMVTTGTATSTRYLHVDHLGSTSAVTNEAGALVERFAYEPFGKRRNANGTTDAAGTVVASSTDRGFTEHEMLDEVGLIHMNGRIYDPALSRFVSADPTIQSPLNLQSFNRYSYAWNTPLNGTDPSGYSLKSFGKSVLQALNHVGRSSAAIVSPEGYYAARRVAQTGGGYFFGSAAISVVSVAFCGRAGPAAAALCNGVGQGAWADLAGRTPVESARVGLMGAATAYASVTVGMVGQADPGAAVFGYSLLGCAENASSTDGCVAGAMSGMAGGAWTSSGAGDYLGRWGNFVGTTTIGGTMSVMAGGKFINGAKSSAFAYLVAQISAEISSVNSDQQRQADLPDEDSDSFQIAAGDDPSAAGHTKNKRESNRQKHEEGDRRRDLDRGNEKADDNRRGPRKAPPNHRGPWPLRTPLPFFICPVCTLPGVMPEPLPQPILAYQMLIRQDGDKKECLQHDTTAFISRRISTSTETDERSEPRQARRTCFAS